MLARVAADGPVLELGDGQLGDASHVGLDGRSEQQTTFVSAAANGAERLRIDLQEATFGGVAVWDLLGFMARPGDFLQILHRSLKPDGALLLTMPTTDGLDARRLRHRWAPLAEPYSWYFDQLNAQTLLYKNGFDRITIWRADRRMEGDAPEIPGRATLAILAHKRPTKPMWKLSVIVPVFNEIATFTRLFNQLYSLEVPGVEKEIIVVESGSTDGTRNAVRAIQALPNVRVIWQDRPLGKGFAVRAGLREATGDFVVIQDADLEYDLNDYAILLEPLIKGSEAFVIGSRHGATGWKIRSFSDSLGLASVLNVGHLIFTALVNTLFNQSLSDPFSMFKVFRRDCIYGLAFQCNRFDFDFELLIKLIRKGYRPLEIPVNYTSRSFAEGKKVSMAHDPLTWLRVLLRLRLQETSAFLMRPSFEQ
jgi:hypothetical protein